MIRILIGLAGFAGGVAVGLLTARTLLKKKYAQSVEEEIEDFKIEWANTLYQRELAAQAKKDAEEMEVAESKFNAAIRLAGTKTNEYENAKEKYQLKNERKVKTVRYDTDFPDNDEDWSETVYEEDVNPPTLEEGKGVEYPYEITEPQFSESMMHYDKMPLTLYSDGVLVEGASNIIDEFEWDEIVGDDIMKRFKESEGLIIYIRNEYIESDYEISKVKEKYYKEEK